MAGHTAVTTVNGQEGFDKIKSDNEFDCVLMDILMPILDGFESAEKIREWEQSPGYVPADRLSIQLNGRIPIFAVSASLLEKQCDKLISCGMDGWILKPVDHKRLAVLLQGITDPSQRDSDLYYLGFSWEKGGWLSSRSTTSAPPTPPLENVGDA